MGVKNRLSLVMFLALITAVDFGGWDSGALGLTRIAAQGLQEGKQVQGKKLSHDETLNWITEHKAWRRARKTKPIWARELTIPESSP